MWYKLLVLVTVTATHSAHVPKKDSDVLVTYEGHAEAVRPVPKPNTGTTRTSTSTPKTGTKHADSSVVVRYESHAEAVRPVPKPNTGTTRTSTSTPKTGAKHADSSVVVRYESHAEAVRPVPKQVDTGTNKTGTSKSGTRKRVEYNADSKYLEHRNNKPCNKGPDALGSCNMKKKTTQEESEVLFIPTRNEDGGEYSRRSSAKKKEEVKLKDVVEKHTLADIINNKIIKVETESPVDGIVFISGKNNENQEETIKKEEEVKITNKKAKEFKQTTEAPLDCKNLNCDNNLASLCGVKKDQGKLKYRLFLNECYYRKVNCAFNHEVNRYSLAPADKCVHVGSHSKIRHIEFSAFLPARPPKPPTKRVEWKEDTRRNFPSRRALSTGLDGALCDHECPTQCSEDYTPVCGISGRQARMFLNHCQMDRHSCVTSTVWQSRPAADCVGQRKADVHNNREFIGWMQRLGVIDNKGKMVMA